MASLEQEVFSEQVRDGQGQEPEIHRPLDVVAPPIIDSSLSGENKRGDIAAAEPSSLPCDAPNGSSGKERLWGGDYLRVWLANFFLYFAFMLITPLLPLFLSDTFNAGKQTTGIVLAGYAAAALLIRPFSGYFVDTFPRKVVLLISYFFSCAIFLGCMAATSLTVFAFFRTVHGAPFGASTVGCTTVAIDVLPSSRRAEGIAYFGLSNNIASAIGPMVALVIFSWCKSYELLFFLSFLTSLVGLILCARLKLKKRQPVPDKKKVSLDRFLLLKSWPQALCITCYALAYGVISTYVAIYGRDELGITRGSGFFFFLLALGLMLSRLVGTQSLRRGFVTRNACWGMAVAVTGYFLFAFFHLQFVYYASALVIGLGQGLLWPAFLTMFLDMAQNSQRGTANATILVSWDLGIGLGMLLGGLFAEHLGYHSAFWMAMAAYGIGILIFFAHGKSHYLRNKLEKAPGVNG